MPARLIFSFLLILLFSCHNKMQEEKDVLGDLQTSPQTSQHHNESTDSVAEPLPDRAPELIEWDKKLIKTATLKLEVEDFKNFNFNLHSLVTQYSGYIAQEQNTFADYRNESVVTIKVPTQRFEELLNQLNNRGKKTIERNISTQDVTSEMTDGKARLEAKKQMRLKYLEFLKKSKNMAEVLQVQNEINSIQEEIESVNGRLSMLSHQTTFSTIALTFYSVISDAPPAEEPTYASRLIKSIGSGIKVIGEFIIVLAGLWPLILLSIGAWILLRKRKVAKV